MKEEVENRYYLLSVGLILMTVFSATTKSEIDSWKDSWVCAQKVLWKMRMCPNNKLVCSKNKEYVDKAKRYIKALGSPNFTRRV